MSSREQSSPNKPSHAEEPSATPLKDMAVREGADAIKGGRPVRKGGDPEDGGE